jgi:hypothetical protein
MTSVQIIVDEIKKVYAISKDFAVGSYCFHEPLDIDISDIAEFACSVSSKLNLENWFLCANRNYFVLEIDDKYIVVYFANDRIDNATEFVIRRCNNNIEYQDLMLAIL